ncbi:MAG: TonB-dependent receptor [Bacteroidales bacterium]|nr:TonB-dependent receptor [Bacteroidales bacterium]
MKRTIIFLMVMTAFSWQFALSQQTISGTVTSAEDNSPLPGVNVMVKGTNQGVVTNVDGVFSIQVPNNEAVLQFSFIGMLPFETLVGEQTNIDVKLEPDVTGLEEVVVVGYGTRKKGALTGSVGLVKAEDIEQSSIASLDQALQGKSAGVQVLQSSGRPGAEALVRIRGVSTINASTDPLYIIDGVPVESDNFAAINPNDIESVSIIKDATAAIYGSQAANGVVFITTKKGIQNKTKVQYRHMSGWSNMTKTDMNMMNAEEKLQYEIDAGFRSGEDASQEMLDSLIAQDHNWFETMSRTAKTTSHELNFSGGSEKTTFYLSGNIYDQEGLVEGSFLDRLTSRANFQHKPSEKFEVSFNSTTGYYNRGELRDRRNVQNPFHAMYVYNPYERPKNPDGTWNYLHTSFNVMEALEKNPERQQQIKNVSSVNIQWEMLNGLTFNSTSGFDFSEITRQTFTMPSSILASYVGDFMRDQMYRRLRQNYTNFLSYEKSFDVHSITLKAGTEAQKFWYKDLLLGVQGFPSDDLAVPAAAAQTIDHDGKIEEWGILSYFGSATYNMSEKYIVDLIARRDASSRFGENNKWANFGAVGVAWNINKEDFLAGISAISNLKIRGTYGTTGNFRYLRTDLTEPYYEALGTYSYFSYNGYSASYPTKIENANLKWETVATFDFGVDFGLFQNRLNGSFAYYSRKTSDLFFPRQVSRTSGFTDMVDNVGNMVNKGIELSLDGDIVRTGDFQWNIGANITTLKNEVVELYGAEDQQIESGFGILKVGEPAYSFYLVKYAGVNSANGDPLFYDVDGNITNQYSDADRVILDKNPHPKFYGSFTNSLKYKGLELSALIYYNYGNYIFSYTVYETESDGMNVADNQSREQLRAWKQPGDITDVPEIRWGTDRAYLTDRNLENGSYLRVRDLTFGYTVPKTLSSKIKVDKFRVYLKGSNLLTIANYKGYDPEVGYNSSESTSAPVGSFDENTYPAVRTISLGVDVGF